MNWTQEQRADIFALRGHRSASDIAEDYGVSRNAIVGVWNRERKRREGKPAKLRRTGPNIATARPAKVKPHLIVCEPVEGVGIPFLDAILDDRCTFPLPGQTGLKGHVCGSARFRGSHYCSACLLKAYQPASSNPVRRAAA